MTPFLIGLAIGFIGGLLVAINNRARTDAAKDKGKALLDALKGK